jgi:hypothetical protein
MVSATCPWAPGFETLGERQLGEVDGLVVHRIEVSQEDATFGDEPREIARFFREHPIGRQATGGGMPYPLLISAAGTITQLVPLGRVTPHAKAHNQSTIGVAAIGDFRRSPPSSAQLGSLVGVCCSLLRQFGLPVDRLAGHDELAQASADPNKECPGRFLPMPGLRAQVAAALERRQTFHAFVW